MTNSFETVPAYTVRPGTMVLEDGVVFSSVFRDCTRCGLILYHLPDLKELHIAFTDAFRYGSLFSVKIPGLDPKEWAYRYYRDDYTFVDPYARELMDVVIDGRKTTLARLFPAPENTLPAYGGAAHDWSAEVIYCLHVKGFTASASSRIPESSRGTFAGVVGKIPYLKKLGVTAVELLPICELRPDNLGKIVGEPRDATEEDRARSRRVTREIEDRTHLAGFIGGIAEGAPQGPNEFSDPDRKPNYWNFGEGYVFAPKRTYAATESPQREFRNMVDALHHSGIRVYLQLYFSDKVSVQTQTETARFYVTHYQIDGFHLKGSSAALRALASDPMLSDTALFCHDFPYWELQKEDDENPTVGKPSIAHLCEYKDDFQTLTRRFVKSDGGVLQDFLRSFLNVPDGAGQVHFVTNYEGFTLRDLVSYNGKHNEANGENGQDGTNDNWSWNCGVEGPSQKRTIRRLRSRQMRNLMALNLLAQGTPVILAGDERGNSQNGNNNAYCQDNETGWINWRETVDGRRILAFTEKMTAFRKEHAILRRKKPFNYLDSKAVGYPDISLHGEEAWKVDLSENSRTAGILFEEAYAEENPRNALLYLALNMHWEEKTLALPKPPEGQEWRVVMDTFLEDSFPEEAAAPDDPRCTVLQSRSIQILQTFPAPRRDPVKPVAEVGIREDAADAEEAAGATASSAENVDAEASAHTSAHPAAEE